MRRKTSRELEELSRRVAEWRVREGGRGSRIPDRLWKEAVRVARVVGVWATARELHFNYKALRARVERAGGGATVREAEPVTVAIARREKPPAIAPVATGGKAGPSFVELEMGQIGSTGRTVIDLLGRHGDRMRVELRGGVDLVDLVQTFWSRAP